MAVAMVEPRSIRHGRQRPHATACSPSPWPSLDPPSAKRQARYRPSPTPAKRQARQEARPWPARSVRGRAIAKAWLEPRAGKVHI
jgi:hypothetical protein